MNDLSHLVWMLEQLLVLSCAFKWSLWPRAALPHWNKQMAYILCEWVHTLSNYFCLWTTCHTLNKAMSSLLCGSFHAPSNGHSDRKILSKTSPSMHLQITSFTEWLVTFTENSSLRNHERTHSEEKSFASSKCVKAFGQSAGLKAHGRTYTGDNPFTCSKCGTLKV